MSKKKAELETINTDIKEKTALSIAKERITIPGYGDSFNTWCIKMGRAKPDKKIIAELNRDPRNALMMMKKYASKFPDVYRSFCTFRSGRGRNV